jgi:hypothetical protein
MSAKIEPAIHEKLSTEGRQGNEETDVGSRKTSKLTPFSPSMVKTPTTLRDLL